MWNRFFRIDALVLRYRQWEEGRGHLPASSVCFCQKRKQGRSKEGERKQGRGNVSCFCIGIPVSDLRLPESWGGSCGSNVFLIPPLASWTPATWRWLILYLHRQWQPQRWICFILFWESFLESHLRTCSVSPSINSANFEFPALKPFLLKIPGVFYTWGVEPWLWVRSFKRFILNWLLNLVLFPESKF